jgi:hypothetical protein
MKLLSIDRSGEHGLTAWILNGDMYQAIVINDHDIVEIFQQVPVAKYKSYLLFIEIMGKFNPYTDFFLEPKPLKDPLDFEQMEDILIAVQKATRIENMEGEENVG